jgi:thiol-disulfide isomerase/thioredoxin
MVRTPTSRLLAPALPILLTLAAACGGPAGSHDAKAQADAAAPDFELADLGGAKVRLSDSAGSVRLIDFWATWCAPCREEIPMLKELHEEYADAGLTILAISDEEADIVAPFAEEHGITYTNLVDGFEVFSEYGALGLPTAYLVDADGKIVEEYFGPKPREVLERRIRELLELPPRT